MKKFTFALLLLLSTLSYSQEVSSDSIAVASYGSDRGGSQIVGKIASFLPNIKEIGFVTNLINVYFQVSQFVRSTTKVIDEMSKIKNDVKQAAYEIKQTYNTIQGLKDVSLYDMKTWQGAVQSLNYIATTQVQDMLRVFDDMKFHAVGAQINFANDILSLDEYAEKRMEALGIISDYYIDSSYSNNLSLLTGIISTAYENRLKKLEEEYVSENAKNPVNAAKIARLEMEIERCEQIIKMKLSVSSPQKIDTIIAASQELIATNIMEIHEMERQLTLTEDKAAELIDAYDKMKGGTLSTTPKKDFEELGGDVKDILDIYSDHPNDVKDPEKPVGGEDPTTVKKEISAQDILQMENGILFLLLKQDIMKRDLSAMKLNSMTFITAIEAFTQEQAELRKIKLNAKTYMMTYRLQDISKKL